MHYRSTSVLVLSLILGLFMFSSCSDPVIPLVELPPEPEPAQSQQSPIENSEDVDIITKEETESGLTDSAIRIAVIS